MSSGELTSRRKPCTAQLAPDLVAYRTAGHLAQGRYCSSSSIAVAAVVAVVKQSPSSSSAAVAAAAALTCSAHSLQAPASKQCSAALEMHSSANRCSACTAAAVAVAAMQHRVMHEPFEVTSTGAIAVAALSVVDSKQWCYAVAALTEQQSQMTAASVMLNEHSAGS
eukprot:9853-Heterococcus_DN1.PRE.2